MAKSESWSLADNVRAHLANLSPNDRKLADFLLSQEREAVFGTADSIARTVGVSKAAVVRFATRLGYAGFSELQQGLQRAVQSHLDSSRTVLPLPSASGP